MAKYRKKPVVIEAMQATGTPESNRDIIDWTRGSSTPATMDTHPEHGLMLTISTLEGAHWVTPGDWIIRGIKGEHYPCKPDIFATTYEAVPEDEKAPSPEASEIISQLTPGKRQALVLISDEPDNTVDLRVTFTPTIDDRSPAHQLVKKLVELNGFEAIEGQAGG